MKTTYQQSNNVSVRCANMPYDEYEYQKWEEEMPLNQLSREIAIAIKRAIDDIRPTRCEGLRTKSD